MGDIVMRTEGSQAAYRFDRYVLDLTRGALLTAEGTAIPLRPKSFTLLYNTVLRPSCSNDYCHYSGVGVRYSALDMSSRSYAYWSLVDQPAAGPGCSRMGKNNGWKSACF